jgi:hypothetical protein
MEANDGDSDVLKAPRQIGNFVDRFLVADPCFEKSDMH